MVFCLGGNLGEIKKRIDAIRLNLLLKGKDFIMKKTLVSISLTLLLISTLYLPNTFAQYQDHTQLSLPGGAKARLGKGWISGDIAYSPDGTRLAVSSSIGIWIYDANTHAEVALFTGHTNQVNSVAFSPDSKTLISGGHDSIVGVWDVHTGQLLHTLEEHNDGVDDVAFSPDGKLFGSIDGDGEIRLWDADTIQLLHTLRDDETWWGSVGDVNCLGFSPDSKWVVGGYYHGDIEFWEVSTGKFLGDSEHSVYWGVNTLAFSSDGITLASGGGNDRVYLLGARTGKHWQTLRGHSDDVNAVVFSPNGKILASGSDDQTVRLWDAFTGEHLRTLKGHTNGVLGVSFSPDGRTIASASWTEIRFWDADTGRQRHILTGHTNSVYGVSFSPDGRTIANGGFDNSIHLWDVSTGTHKQALKGHKGDVYSVAFSPGGKTLASGGQAIGWESFKTENLIYLWDVSTGHHKQTFTETKGDVYSVSFSPDGKTLASGSSSGDLRLWDIETGEERQTLDEWGSVRSVSFSPDGQMLVSTSVGDGNRRGGIHLWHLRTGRRLKTLLRGESKYRNTYSVVFSPDGRIIAGSVNDEIWFWDSRSGERLKILTGHKDGHNIFSVVFSPDGKTLASGSSDDTIRLWDATTGAYKQTLIGHTDSVIDVSFSQDSRTLISGSSDGTILLWDLAPHDTTSDTPSTPATSDATVSISATPVQSPTIGELLTFPLNITNGESVSGYQASVEFDTTALQYVKSANGDYLSSGAFFVPPVAEGNKVTLAATSLSGESDGDGTLATLTFKLVALKSSTLKLSEVSLVGSDGVRSSPQIEDTEVEITEASHLAEDVNEDGVVNILDLTAVAANFGQTGESSADVNEDGVVDIVDLVLVAGALGSDAAAPSALGRGFEVSLTRADVQQWLTQARGLDLTDAAQRGVIFLEQLLAALTPKETALLPNYPNPFNPETWIPYQLAESADVTVSIYAANGVLIRTLTLGHQPIGIYESRSRAAYWDGRNTLGEPVASGVYFYTLTAGEFTATRKMLIMK